MATLAEIEAVLHNPNATEAEIAQAQAMLDARPDYGENSASSYRFDNFEHRS